MQHKLKPCPFCGGNNLELKENRESGFSMRVRCESCHAFSFDKHATSIYTGNYMCPLALRAWNTRATDKTIEALVDALKTVKPFFQVPEGVKALTSGAQEAAEKIEAALLAAGGV